MSMRRGGDEGKRFIGTLAFIRRRKVGRRGKGTKKRRKAFDFLFPTSGEKRKGTKKEEKGRGDQKVW